MLAIRTRVEMASKDGSLTLAEPRNPLWWGLRAEDHQLSSFGMKLSGGGAHQSKTMMFRELVPVRKPRKLLNGRELRS